jgi:hypothetical protein
MTATLVLSVDVDAPVEQTWAAVTDWARQGEWMVGTRVWPTTSGGRGVGGGIEAFTGVGPLGFLDRMRITRWEPPLRCEVMHVGRVVRGPGLMEVRPRGEGRSTLVWREDLDLPLGVVGRLGWPLVRPAFARGVQLSLRRFARWVETGRAASRPSAPADRS